MKLLLIEINFKVESHFLFHYLNIRTVFMQIKATCPHRYVVKPHRGEIPASSNIEIDVTLLPFHFRETEKYNDKFLLQVGIAGGVID